MEPEVVEKWNARIIAEEVSVLAPGVQSGAQFLARARNQSESWGPYPGMPIDLACSAAALEALESCENAEFEPTIRTSRIRLRDYIRAHLGSLDLAGSTASLRILAHADRSGELCELAESIISRVRELRSGAGWGSPVAAIPASADALSALLPYRDMAGDLISSAVEVLFDQRKQDGGWPVLLGGKLSAPVPSALAIYALVAAEPEQQNSAFQSGASYLQGILNRGWPAILSESGSIQAVAQILRAAASLKALPFDLVQQGVQLILMQQNTDGAWAERKGGNSNVETTAVCLLSLGAAGANRLVSSKFALSALTAAGTALQEANRELDQMRNNVRSQVTRETRAILDENDRLSSRIIELEKEKKILIARVDQSERTLLAFRERISDQIDIGKGSESLRRSLGWFDYLQRSAARILPGLGLLMATIASVYGLKLFGEKIGLGATQVKYFDWLLIGTFSAGAAGLLFDLFRRSWKELRSIRLGGLEVDLGAIGTSDRKLVLRGLSTAMSSLPTGARESFLHQLNQLRRLEPALREATARSIARQYSDDGDSPDDLRVFLSLFGNLPESEQRDVVYSLREVQGRVASS